MDVADRLRQHLVIDGGLASLLEHLGADLIDELWSARLLLDDPDTICRAHRAYFEAGADVAIGASYQASFEGFARRGIDRGGSVALFRRSVELAREAAEGLARRAGHRSSPRRSGRTVPCSPTDPNTTDATA